MDDEQSKAVNENEQVLNTSKDTYDPGWNDPPKISYSSVGQTKFIKKGLLNKRVSFPFSSDSAVKPSTSIQSATPPKCDTLSSGDSPLDVAISSTQAPVLIPTTIMAPDNICPKSNTSQCALAPTTSLETINTNNQELSLDRVMYCFNEVIKELIIPENTDKLESDIRKRLETMKKMWLEDKLDKAVKEKMVQLAEALLKGEGSLANDKHIEIIVDHTGQVNTWMPGVRKLVHCSMLAEEKSLEKLETDLQGKEDSQCPNNEGKSSP